MNRNIDIFGICNHNGLIFKSGFSVTWRIGDETETWILVFNNEKHFEKLTGLNIDTFHVQDLLGIIEIYQYYEEINLNSTIETGQGTYDFTEWHKPLKYSDNDIDKNNIKHPNGFEEYLKKNNLKQ